MVSCLSLITLDLLSEEHCRAWWLRRLHPAGPACPCCGVAVQGRQAVSWANDKRLRCAVCGKWFTNVTKTPVDTCHATWCQLTVIAILIPAGIRVASVAKISRLSDDTVRRIVKRLHLEVHHA